MHLLLGQGGVIGALLCTSDFLHPRHSTALCICHRGWSQPPAKPLTEPAPKAAKFVPNPQTRVQPNLLPRWQPSLQLDSPFLWPLLSMCSFSESNTRTRKSGVELNMHPNRQFPAHICGSYALMSHVCSANCNIVSGCFLCCALSFSVCSGIWTRVLVPPDLRCEILFLSTFLFFFLARVGHAPYFFF